MHTSSTAQVACDSTLACAFHAPHPTMYEYDGIQYRCHAKILTAVSFGIITLHEAYHHYTLAPFIDPEMHCSSQHQAS